MLLAISLGNSNLRYKLVEDDRVVARGALPLCLEPERLTGLEEIDRHASAATELAVVSVHPTALAALEPRLRARAPRVRIVGDSLTIPIENRYEDPASVGIDRLLAVFAATRRFPGRGVIVIDLGTALTLNVGAPDGAFLGGSIAIGLASILRSLPLQAPMLPEVLPGRPVDVVPASTEAALRAGAFWQVLGAIERSLRELRARVPFECRVVLTGGDASLVGAELDGVDLVEPELLLDGVIACIREAGG